MYLVTRILYYNESLAPMLRRGPPSNRLCQVQGVSSPQWSSDPPADLAAPSSCELGLPRVTGVSAANASAMLLYRTLIWTEVCGRPRDPNSTFAADVATFHATSNATVLLAPGGKVIITRPYIFL